MVASQTIITSTAVLRRAKPKSEYLVQFPHLDGSPRTAATRAPLNPETLHGDVTVLLHLRRGTPKDALAAVPSERSDWEGLLVARSHRSALDAGFAIFNATPAKSPSQREVVIRPSRQVSLGALPQYFGSPVIDPQDGSVLVYVSVRSRRTSAAYPGNRSTSRRVSRLPLNMPADTMFLSVMADGDDSDFWVNQLARRLQSRLSMYLGRESTVFFERAMARSATPPKSRADAISRSKMFLAVVSPACLESDWCRQELRLLPTS